MSDLIKSITTISVNDVLEEAFEAAVETTPGNNDLILSYNPVSQTLGKSAFPADATAIANEAKAKVTELETSVNILDVSRVTIAENGNKTVSFTTQHYIPQFNVDQPYQLNIDYTNAKVGGITFLSILQNAEVTWNGQAFMLGGNAAKAYIPGKVNKYIIAFDGIDFVIARNVKFSDLPVDPGQIVVENTPMETAQIGNKSISLVWPEAENALSYEVDKALSADFSDAISVYAGEDESVIVPDLDYETHYYFRKRGVNGTKYSEYAYADATTLEQFSYTTTYRLDNTTAEITTTGEIFSNPFPGDRGRLVTWGFNHVPITMDSNRRFSLQDQGYFSNCDSYLLTGIYRMTFYGIADATLYVDLHPNLSVTTRNGNTVILFSTSQTEGGIVFRFADGSKTFSFTGILVEKRDE